MSEEVYEDHNLASQIFQEPIEEEHDQALVNAIRIAGVWHEIIPGSLDLAFNDMGEVEFYADKPSLGDPFIQGKLSDITGLKSLPAEDENGTESGA
jgi:hypothetical protein